MSKRRAVLMALRKMLGRERMSARKIYQHREAAERGMAYLPGEHSRNAAKGPPSADEIYAYRQRAERGELPLPNERPRPSDPRSSITGKTNYGEDMPAPMARANNANPISVVDQEFGPRSAGYTMTGKEKQLYDLLRANPELSNERAVTLMYGGMDAPEAKVIDVYRRSLRSKGYLDDAGKVIE